MTLLERTVPELDALPVARVRAGAGAVAPVLAIGGALLLWTLSVRSIDLRAMTGLGLVSVLPARAFAALALLVGSFGVMLRRGRASAALLAAHVVALVFMLYALPALVEPTARFAVTWRHAGVMQAIVDAGRIHTGPNPYFDWPGFFVLAGVALKAAGLGGVLGAANWAPFAFELLYLAPLLVILRALTGDRLVVWLAVWLFYLGNWVGQDYFSPQAFAFLLYLVAVAVLVAWLAPEATGAGARRGARAALVAVVVLLFAAVVVSHQLTPFALLLATTALVAARRCTARGLPVAMAVLLLIWLAYVAIGFVGGHTDVLIGGIGHLDATVSENVPGRLHGDPAHLVVVRARIVLTGALWAAALAGVVLRWRAGRRDPTAPLLFAAPFALALLQPYGGEILLRVFLFALPFAAFLAASALRRAPLGALLAVTLTLAPGLLVMRYGNERMDWFSAGEVRAVDRLDALAPPGTTLVAWSNSLPWQARHYADHHYRSIVTSSPGVAIRRMRPGSPQQVAAVARYMRALKGGAFLVLTRSQAAEADLTGLGPPGSVPRVEAALRRSRAFRLLYADRDASVFALAAQEGP